MVDAALKAAGHLSSHCLDNRREGGPGEEIDTEDM